MSNAVTVIHSNVTQQFINVKNAVIKLKELVITISMITMRTKIKVLFGKNATKSAFGMTGCIHGMCCENVEYCMYGVKNIIGSSIEHRWG